MRTPRGLTLLEIIVVIVMIALFAALILPLLPTRKIHARRTQCASNIRQLLTAMYLYSDSNPHLFPTTSRNPNDPFDPSLPASEALNVLYPTYVSDVRIFVCPSDPQKPSLAMLHKIPKWGEMGPRPDAPMTPAHTSYAYDPGHSTNISSMVALLSDKPGEKGNSDNHGSNAGQNVGFGTSVEFRESVKNPLDEGGMDNNIFTLGDTTSGVNGIKISRDEDSFIRR